MDLVEFAIELSSKDTNASASSVGTVPQERVLVLNTCAERDV